ncbi:MAG: FecR domain-containing protein [Bacteroidetes bacterium]|nr:FecR domain-containing protein [Bacteroidota bacterium]
MNKSRFTELVNLYLLDRITDRQGVELAAMLKQPVFQAEFERVLLDQLRTGALDLEEAPAAVYGRIQNFLESRLNGVADDPVHTASPAGSPGEADGSAAGGNTMADSVPRVGPHFIRRRWLPYAAAVAALVAGVYVFHQNREPTLLSQAKRFHNDLRPGARGATLTLPDGSLVPVRDNLPGTNSGFKVSTGKGEFYSLTLADGTKVWLNSLSSLHCEAGYGTGNRLVTLTGEAYFEVRHDERHPFSVVLPDGTLVRDIGTRFNIHAYGDEKVVRTTVVEGSVQVQTKASLVRLTPGEEAQYSSGGQIKMKDKVNLASAVAWKDERFILDATPVRSIMQQAERWYGAEIVYRDGMDKDTTQYFGTLPRGIPVSGLLKMLEATGHVHFTIEGNKITVMK